MCGGGGGGGVDREERGEGEGGERESFTILSLTASVSHNAHALMSRIITSL